MAFRSVPRLSSPPGAKASTECPSHAREHRISLAGNPNHHVQEPSTPDFPGENDPHNNARKLSLHTTDPPASRPANPQKTPLNTAAVDR